MAVDLGNSVLSKAQETLQILQDFDSTVEENRADFEAIMQETNAIEVIFSDKISLFDQSTISGDFDRGQFKDSTGRESDKSDRRRHGDCPRHRH